jgi:uncharacterized protein YjbJ (UPF0337 family)
MNWDSVSGQWKQLKGNIRQEWAKLTDDDIEYIAGSRDKFVGKLQERYGYAHEEAERRADAFGNRFVGPGYAADGTPDTRGVGEKIADAITGDRVDDKTGKVVR